MAEKSKSQEEFEAVATEVDAATEVDGNVPEATQAPEGEQGLNLSDIRACVTIIDIVTKRGAFEGAELADVGSVRNRLDSFLKAAAEAQAPAEESTEA
jgi:hypothetical protein